MLNLNLRELPKCPNCEKGVLVPLEDFMCKENSSISWVKAWACPSCGAGVKLNAGEIVKQGETQRFK